MPMILLKDQIILLIRMLLKKCVVKLQPLYMNLNTWEQFGHV